MHSRMVTHNRQGSPERASRQSKAVRTLQSPRPIIRHQWSSELASTARALSMRMKLNPRRACAARVALCVCVSGSSSYSVRFSLQPTASTAFILGFQLVDFRKSLPFKSYGEKKPICKLVSSREPFSRTFWTNETQELLEAQPVSRILLQTLASSAASVK